MAFLKKGGLLKKRLSSPYWGGWLMLSALVLQAVVFPQSLLASAAAVDGYIAQWVISFGGLDAGEGTGIAVDNASNVYTTGYFQNRFSFGGGDNDPERIGQTDIYISKSDKDGNFVWAKAMGGTNIDEARAIAVDGNGSTYATGHFRDTVDFDPNVGVANRTSVGDDDVFVVKLDTNGGFVWANGFGGPTIDEGYGIAASGNSVAATGFFSGTTDFNPATVGGTGVLTSTASSRDIFVVNYNSADGAFKWVNYVAGVGNNDRGNGAAIDQDGNVYITGYFGTADTNFNPNGPPAIPSHASSRDIFILKYNSAGVFQWVRAMGFTGSDVGNAIVADDAGNVYVTGSFVGTVDFDPAPEEATELISAGEDDIFVLALKSDGAFNWAKQIGGVGRDQGTGLALDAEGNLHITGSFSSNVDFDPGDGVVTLSSQGVEDAFAIMLNASGELLAAGQMGGTLKDVGTDIAADSNGIYVTGSYEGTSDFDPSSDNVDQTAVGNSDIFVVNLQTQARNGSAVGKSIFLPVVER